MQDPAKYKNMHLLNATHAKLLRLKNKTKIPMTVLVDRLADAGVEALNLTTKK